MFIELSGTRQTAKVINSALMELINGVEDNIEETKEDPEVIRYISKQINYMY